MTAEHDDLRARSLLAVFAHPDDESLACGGLLAWCAELGARVSVCCATRGELGQTAGMGSSSECSRQTFAGSGFRNCGTPRASSA